jgi:lysozyme family protein
MGDFNDAVEFVLADRIEGGYVEHPEDPGGATNFGISTRFLRSIGEYRDVRSLTRQDAINLYRKYFWDKVCGDQIADQDLALCLFDAAVNQGPAAAVRFLQEALNRYEAGASLPVDGVMGPETVAVANAVAPDASTGDELEFRYILWRLQHYAALANNKPQFRTFIRGWLNRMLYLFDQVN